MLTDHPHIKNIGNAARINKDGTVGFIWYIATDLQTDPAHKKHDKKAFEDLITTIQNAQKSGMLIGEIILQTVS